METQDEDTQTVTYTASEVTLLQTILNRALQVALSEAGRSPNPRNAVKEVQNVINLLDLIESDK